MARTSSARDDILSAAGELFRARGYEGVGVAEILETAEAPRGSLYFHFPDGKEQIGVEVVTRLGEEVAAQFRGLGERKINLDAYIDTVFRHTAKMVRERDYDASCPIGAISAELSEKTPALREALKGVLQSWEREVSLAARARGLASKDADIFASALIAAMEGAYVLSKAQGSTAMHNNAGAAIKALAAHLAKR